MKNLINVLYYVLYYTIHYIKLFLLTLLFADEIGKEIYTPIKYHEYFISRFHTSRKDRERMQMIPLNSRFYNHQRPI